MARDQRREENRERWRMEENLEGWKLMEEKMEIKACRETADKCCFLWSGMMR